MPTQVVTILSLPAVLLMMYPVIAYGFASEVALSDCGCKWDKDKLVVWIENRSESKYTDIAIKAMTEWQNSFTGLSYVINTLPPDQYDIVITIHKTYGGAVGLPKETIGFATNEKKPNSNELIYASIDVPTSYRNPYGSMSKISETVFYNMVLHEFGHAIGLGHAVDNNKDPIDPMHHSIYLDEKARKVSELDVSTLEKLYE